MSLSGIGKMLTPRNTVIGVISANMICRPIITMSNKNLPEDTKKYTATREFCTELFGLINTITFASAVEYLGPKLINNKLTRKMMNDVKKADWDKLSPPDQKIKGAILVSSLVGTAIAAAVLTPLLNNLVLNKFMDKITGKNKTAAPKPLIAETPKLATVNIKDSFSKFNNVCASTKK